MDLQSSAAAVLGYRQAPVKGKAIEVAPVHEVATERLRALLRSALSPQARPVPHAERHMQHATSDLRAQQAWRLAASMTAQQAGCRTETYKGLASTYGIRLTDSGWMVLWLRQAVGGGQVRSI